MPLFSRWARRLASVLAVFTIAAMTMGLADNAVRYNDLGHKMMCVCGCNQILIECNHLGCPDSDRMLGELRTALSQGKDDNAILVAFQDEYGPTVLAAPMLTKFNVIAWVVPPILLLMGIGGTVLLVRRWRLRAAAMPAVQRTPQALTQFTDMRERVRRETEL
jgi:cytochrome c-type biogenesis protein CcmH/NrfF